MKRSQPKREWSAAREKVDEEGRCRVCVTGDARQAAHIVGREHDFKFPGGTTGMNAAGLDSTALYVHPDRIVPLCASCHRRYDPHTRGLNEEPLDLLPYLTDQEKRQAFEDCGYDALKFLKRVCGVGFVPEEAT